MIQFILRFFSTKSLLNALARRPEIVSVNVVTTKDLIQMALMAGAMNPPVRSIQNDEQAVIH